MGKREEIAKEFDVNLHYPSDGADVRRNTPELGERIMRGEIDLQQALRELAVCTQSDRNRHRAKIVESLCRAVLDEDYRTARQLAVYLLSSRLRGAKRKEFLNSYGFTQEGEK